MTLQRPAFRHTVALQMEGYRDRLARAIKDHRRETGMGSGELGDRVGVSARTVERWEAGTAAPQPASRKRLAELLDVPVESLQPDQPYDPIAIERIEAKLDLLLRQAGLPVDFDSVVAELETTIAEVGQPGDSTGSRSEEQPPGPSK